MKLAISYTTMYDKEMIRQSLPRVTMNPAYDLHIVDGSVDVWRPASNGLKYYEFHPGVRGGADAALAFCLSMMLNHEANYTHVGIVEMDVLLDEDWFEPTMALFEKGRADGLHVGAVSPRSYVDRVLIQREGYACVHNLGAGVVVFTREAAEIVLRSFRTHWWSDNRKLFAQLSGIDLATYAAFRGNEQWVTTDWGWDAQLAAHGLASLAPTPARCTMIGQKIPLEQQGLELTTGHPQQGLHVAIMQAVFERYRDNLAKIRSGTHKPAWPGPIHRDGAGMLFFPHQLGYLEATWQGTLESQWSQGFGPFAYRAGEGGASLSVLVSGTCGFLVDGGLAGARVTIEDTRSGFRASPDLPPSQGQPVSVGVPGSPIPRLLTMKLTEGAVFCGLHTADQQMIDTSFRFDWSQLPEAK
jgi:hypothetical protein